VYCNLTWFVQQSANDPSVQLSRIALVLGSGLEAGDAPPVAVGVELELEADGAPSITMGLSIPHREHMLELDCFSMMSTSAATGSLSAA
jgi:hypothetical protein